MRLPRVLNILPPAAVLALFATFAGSMQTRAQSVLPSNSPVAVTTAVGEFEFHSARIGDWSVSGTRYDGEPATCTVTRRARGGRPFVMSSVVGNNVQVTSFGYRAAVRPRTDTVRLSLGDGGPDVTLRETDSAVVRTMVPVTATARPDDLLDRMARAAAAGRSLSLSEPGATGVPVVIVPLDGFEDMMRSRDECLGKIVATNAISALGRPPSDVPPQPAVIRDGVNAPSNAAEATSAPTSGTATPVRPDAVTDRPVPRPRSTGPFFSERIGPWRVIGSMMVSASGPVTCVLTRQATDTRDFTLTLNGGRGRTLATIGYDAPNPPRPAQANASFGEGPEMVIRNRFSAIGRSFPLEDEQTREILARLSIAAIAQRSFIITEPVAVNALTITVFLEGYEQSRGRQDECMRRGTEIAATQESAAAIAAAPLARSAPPGSFHAERVGGWFMTGTGSVERGILSCKAYGVADNGSPFVMSVNVTVPSTDITLATRSLTLGYGGRADTRPGRVMVSPGDGGAGVVVRNEGPMGERQLTLLGEPMMEMQARIARAAGRGTMMAMSEDGDGRPVLRVSLDGYEAAMASQSECLIKATVLAVSHRIRAEAAIAIAAARPPDPNRPTRPTIAEPFATRVRRGPVPEPTRFHRELSGPSWLVEGLRDSDGTTSCTVLRATEARTGFLMRAVTSMNGRLSFSYQARTPENGGTRGRPNSTSVSFNDRQEPLTLDNRNTEEGRSFEVPSSAEAGLIGRMLRAEVEGRSMFMADLPRSPGSTSITIPMDGLTNALRDREECIRKAAELPPMTVDASGGTVTTVTSDGEMGVPPSPPTPPPPPPVFFRDLKVVDGWSVWGSRTGEDYHCIMAREGEPERTLSFVTTLREGGFDMRNRVTYITALRPAPARVLVTLPDQTGLVLSAAIPAVEGELSGVLPDERVAETLRRLSLMGAAETNATLVSQRDIRVIETVRVPLAGFGVALAERDKCVAQVTRPMTERAVRRIQDPIPPRGAVPRP